MGSQTKEAKINILRAVGAALAAMMVTVLVWCEESGKFLLKCLPGYRAADPQSLLDQYVEVAKTEATAHKPDERLANIQQVADLLFRQQPIPDAVLVGLGDRTLAWLEALNGDMLLLASKAKPEVLQAHLKGTRTITGLLAYDADSIEAYQQALARDAMASKPEPRRQRAEQIFPVFGAMC